MSHNQSLVCTIDKNQKYLARALDETERFAREENLDQKKSLHLRLLCEELIGMVDTIVPISYGEYWLDQKDGEYQLHLEANAIVTADRKASLLKVTPDGKNAAYVGVMGKITEFFDRMAEGSGCDMSGVSGDPTMINMYNWSFQSYMETMRAQKKELDWDEMEKSILTKLTKDIKVAVRENEIRITMIAK